MKNFTAILIALALFSTLSCSENKKLIRTERINPMAKQNTVVADRILNVEVNGMSCEMSCGASLKTALLNSGAVETCKIDFKDKRKTNVLEITYDSKKIDGNELKEIITQLNDGQFSIGMALDETLNTSVSLNIQNDSKQQEESFIETKEPEIKNPNILGLITRFILR